MPYKIEIDKKNNIFKAIISGKIDKETSASLVKETYKLMKGVKPQTISALFDLSNFELTSDIDSAVKMSLDIQKNKFFTNLNVIMPDNEKGKELIDSLREKYNIIKGSFFVFEGL